MRKPPVWPFGTSPPVVGSSLYPALQQRAAARPHAGIEPVHVDLPAEAECLVARASGLLALKMLADEPPVV
jgi:hypothetical protein